MASPSSSQHQEAQSVDPNEIGYFENLASQWWDEQGPFAALQAMTPARVHYIKTHAARLLPHMARLQQGDHQNPIKGLRILDIGCGGGLLAEPLARLGAEVTGLDASEGAIGAARDHAERAGLAINYLHDSAEDLAKTGVSFDIIIASEVIEHVQDRQAFLNTMAAFGHQDAPSMVILTTINRSVAGVALVKYAAEYVLNLAPKGTHDPQKFVKPSELKAEAFTAGIDLDDITGIQPRLTGGFKLGGLPLMNYAAAGVIRR